MAVQRTKSSASSSLSSSPLPVRSKPAAVVSGTNKPSVAVPRNTTGGARGPALTWNTDRRKALIAAIRNGVTNKATIVTHLRAHPAFSDIPSAAITTLKVGDQIKKIRNKAAKEDKEGTADRSALIALLDTVQAGTRDGLDLDALEAADEDEEDTESKYDEYGDEPV